MFSTLFKVYPQYIMPGHLISRFTHKLTRIRQRGFKNNFIKIFMKLFKIDLTEAEISDIDHFEHFNAFFTRALKEGVRPITNESTGVCSPVDGTVSQAGPIENGKIFQAKGHTYSALELLGGDSQLAERFKSGVFTTIYLSPRDYHRIHIPVDGSLKQMIHVPGRLFSVNPATTNTVPGLFARNERVISIFDTPGGLMAVAKIGAVNVGSIETVWAGEVTPPAGRTIKHWSYSNNPKYTKGSEIGRFNMGSTVILLFENSNIQWESHFKAEQKVKMGELIAKWS
jgi:phosphatidylserine decarboxylase